MLRGGRRGIAGEARRLERAGRRDRRQDDRRLRRRRRRDGDDDLGGVGLGARLDRARVREQPAGDQGHTEGGQDGRQGVDCEARRTCSRERHATSGGRDPPRDARTGTLPPHGVPAVHPCRPVGRSARRGARCCCGFVFVGPDPAHPSASASAAPDRPAPSIAPSPSVGSSPRRRAAASRAGRLRDRPIGRPSPRTSASGSRRSAPRSRPRPAVARPICRTSAATCLGELHAGRPARPAMAEFPLTNGFAARYADDGPSPSSRLASRRTRPTWRRSPRACRTRRCPMRSTATPRPSRRWARTGCGAATGVDVRRGRPGRGIGRARRRHHGPRRPADPAGARGRAAVASRRGRPRARASAADRRSPPGR